MSGDEDEAELLALAARLRAVEERLDSLDDPIADIREKLDTLLGETAAKPKCFHWPDLDDDDGPPRWTAFLEWLQNTLCARYPQVTQRLRACWWQHPDAVDALTAAWFAWLGAYRVGDAAPDAPADWQGRRLPALVAQLDDTLSSCGRGHEPNVPALEAFQTVPTTLP